MDRLEAVKALNRIPVNYIGMTIDEANRADEALSMAARALRPITREQVEKMKASVTNVNDDDPWCNYGQCTACGDYIMVDNFCPVCGAPFTDEAVDMVMKRLEAVRDE